MMEKTFVIAEAGVNHNGSFELAKKLIDAAKLAGADAVKFQTFKAKDLVTRFAEKAAYQNKTTFSKTQFEMLKKLELTKEQFKKLFIYCKKNKIIFLSTPFDYESAEFLNKLNMRYFKISSGDITNIPFLKKIASYGKPVILSTGMSTISEIREAVNAIYSAGNRKLILLHCTSCYPVNFKDINLRAMSTLRKFFNVPVGYSDHSLGIEVAIAAVALGANFIEKHFTLDKHLKGPDHFMSLDTKELKAMIAAIRNIEKAMGSIDKKITKCEYELKKTSRRSIVAACEVKKGARLNENMLAIKRPGIGIPPKYINRLIGRKTNSNIRLDEVIRWGQIK